jgi:NMD protein affecting ribosome stability and mRNA decay
MSNGQQYGSGEYTPTPSHALPAFSRNGKGFICPACGHLEISLDDSLYDDLCPKCVVTALRRLGVPQMMTIKDYHRNLAEALEPTVKINKPSHERTTEVYIRGRRK